MRRDSVSLAMWRGLILLCKDVAAACRNRILIEGYEGGRSAWVGVRTRIRWKRNDVTLLSLGEAK